MANLLDRYLRIALSPGAVHERLRSYRIDIPLKSISFVRGFQRISAYHFTIERFNDL